MNHQDRDYNGLSLKFVDDDMIQLAVDLKPSLIEPDFALPSFPIDNGSFKNRKNTLERDPPERKID